MKCMPIEVNQHYEKREVNNGSFLNAVVILCHI